MRLEFTPVTEQEARGRIPLSLPDSKKSHRIGSFVAAVKPGAIPRAMKAGRRGPPRLTVPFLLAAAAGCGVPPPAPGGPDAPGPAMRATIVGRSVEWRPIECLALGDGKEVVLFLAAIHGSERAGTPLLRRLARHLQGHPALLEGRTVRIVPEANPDGAARGRRANARGVDLNRNFPSANRVGSPRCGGAPLSEPEALAIAGLILERRPVRVVTLHEPLGCVDCDGPGADLAERMAAACGLPLRRIGGLPGSLGSYVGDTLGIPIVTLELPPGAFARGEDRLWEQYGGALVEAVAGCRTGETAE